MHVDAIVIRKRPLKERDQMVVLYTRGLGRISAVAKGSLSARSRQAPALDEGSFIRCELVKGRLGPIMTGAQAIRGLSRAKRSPVVWASVQFFLQVLDVLVFDGQPDMKLWDAATETLANLDEAGEDNLLRVHRACQRRFLEALGYGRPSHHDAKRWARCALDERFEALAQRRLSALDLLYDVAATRYP